MNSSGTVIFRGREVPWNTRFAEDLHRIYTDEIVSRGARPDPQAGMSDLGRHYHELRRRRLEWLTGTKCRIRYSTVIRQQPRNPAVSKLADLFRRGEPIWPYTSEQTKESVQDDWLLNDWGVFHLHLGAHINPGRYAGRTKKLLYVWPDDRLVYLLGVFDHEAFADRELVDILLSEWPAALERYRIRGFEVNQTPPSPDIVTSGRMRAAHRTIMFHPTAAVAAPRTKQLRAQGLVAPFQSRSGALYYPPGGGYSCGRSGTLPRIHADHEVWWAERLAEAVRGGIEIISRELERCAPEQVDKLEFHVRTLDEMKNSLIFEEASNVVVRLQHGSEFDRNYDPIPMLKAVTAANMALAQRSAANNA